MSGELCLIEGLTVEHLSGFDKVTLGLDRQNTVLVGPNNSGKTSLLKILDWVFNGVDEALLLGRRPLSNGERDLLLPARDTRGGARRLTLHCRIADGRRARGYAAEDGVARLRLQFRGDGVFAALGAPRRGDGPTSDPKALKLLELVHSSRSVLYVPSARDAASDAFEAELLTALKVLIEEKFVHRDRGGAPGDYRRVKRALEDILGVAEGQAATLWAQLANALPAGHVRDARIEFAAGPEELARWVADTARLRASTGAHDERMVSPEALGSGTQSLLLMALLGLQQDEKRTLLLEEPEAFLHPSAQRALARSLFDAQRVRVIASTHSPVIVDESVAADVVVVREHKVFSPRDVDSRRRQINSALLTGQGSEAIFSRSVLLVEGAGDRAFFERLRRRLGEYVDVGRLSSLGIVAVGGKAQFGPWIQLLESYKDQTGERPIHWLAVADGVDASGDLARGLRDGGIVIENDLDRRLREVAQAHSRQDHSHGARLSRYFNDAALSRGLPAALLPIDLEYSALARSDEGTISALAAQLGTGTIGRDALLAKLGSKALGQPSAQPLKADWIRAEIASSLPWPEVSIDVKHVLRRWLAPVLGPDATYPRPLGNRKVRGGRRSSRRVRPPS